MILWRVFQKYPAMYQFKDQISYPEIQDLFALVQMEEDYTSATRGYFEWKIEKERQN